MEQETYLLKYSEAKHRSLLVSNVDYFLKLTLSQEFGFAGQVLITFTTSSPSSDLWLDYKGHTVSSVSVNGNTIPVSYSNAKVMLGALPAGDVQVEINFQNSYSHDGLGLHGYTDPEDKTFYLYTQFEPFAANRVFPCFDQPDLKARWDLSVKCPTSWAVISNEPGTVLNNPQAFPIIPDYHPESETAHHFPGKYKLSTYLYALCAGNYAVFTKPENEVNIPMNIYCRQSLAKYMVPDRYFHWIIEGFKFYQNFFNRPYPFTKYDNVFAPEFLFGAMENVGCVTYRDQYVFKDPPTHVQLIRVCDTFLHEMAHMWFGDLVTMKWWDDLWLNESFATFMSSLATSVQLSDTFPDVWIEFLSSKGWGYSTDQLSTTHPICTAVNDTNETETNFDGISYSKGSAVLKQLYYLVGDNVFKTALSRYMEEFQFRNAEFKDLIEFISNASKETGSQFDIFQWADSWVKTAGLNELEPKIKYEEGKIVELIILQRPALENHPTLRNHSIEVEAFDEEMKSVKRVKVDVLPQSETKISDFDGLGAKAVVLNVGDWGYCKLRLDSESSEAFFNKLSSVQDPLTRQLVYRALWDEVRDTKISGVQFIEMVLNQIPLEQDAAICNYALEITSSALNNYVPDSPFKDSLAHRLFLMVLKKIQNSAPEASKMYQKVIKSFLYRQDDIELGVSWVVNNSTGIHGWELGKLDRWSILKTYSKVSESAKAIVDAEYETDKSNTGHLSKIYCEAAYPNASNKEALWNKFLTDGEQMSRYDRAEVMGGFNASRQRELLNKYADLFFDNILNVINSKDREYSKDFCECLMPAYMDEGYVISKIEEVTKLIPEERFDISREMKEHADILKRIKAGKECSLNYINKVGYNLE